MSVSGYDYSMTRADHRRWWHGHYCVI